MQDFTSLYKFLITFNNFPVTLYLTILDQRPALQTLSKALVKSINAQNSLDFLCLQYSDNRFNININGGDVQRKNVVNNVDKSSLWAP